MRFTLVLAHVSLFSIRRFRYIKELRKDETFYMGGIAIIMTVSFTVWLVFNIIRECLI